MNYSISEVSRLSGVPIVSLRDWDRRHGVAPTFRTLGAHRRYTPRDVELIHRISTMHRGGLTLARATAQARTSLLHGFPDTRGRLHPPDFTHQETAG